MLYNTKISGSKLGDINALSFFYRIYAPNVNVLGIVSLFKYNFAGRYRLFILSFARFFINLLSFVTNEILLMLDKWNYFATGIVLRQGLRSVCLKFIQNLSYRGKQKEYLLYFKRIEIKWFCTTNVFLRRNSLHSDIYDLIYWNKIHNMKYWTWSEDGIFRGKFTF